MTMPAPRPPSGREMAQATTSRCGDSGGSIDVASAVTFGAMPFGPKPIPAEDDGGNLLQRLPVIGPLRNNFGRNARYIFGVLQAILDQPAARGDLVRARRMRAGPNENQDLCLRRRVRRFSSQ